MAASRPGFEKLMRALSMTEWAGQDGIDVEARSEALRVAYRTARSALEDLSDLRSEIGAEMSVLESTRDSHDDYIAYAQNAISVIEDVDIAEAVSRLERDQVALQGSYLALSRITSLNLIDFIR
jgi:flagellar hook-associated protein 3 FlgL